MKNKLRGGTIVYPFLLEVEDVNCYLCVNSETKRAVLVDAGEFSSEIEDLLKREKIKVEAILLTHTHYDHIGGLNKAVPALGATVYVHEKGESAVGQFRHEGVKDGAAFSAAGFEIIPLATEGHTPDSMCYLIDDALFTGDTLFNGSVGGTSQRAQFCQETDNVREKLFRLADNVVVFPGHGPATTVGIERVCNPFF
jgi:glyoxylase-like metal-dependent hydrolase (beta-lactamase superfamily II)